MSWVEKALREGKDDAKKEQALKEEIIGFLTPFAIQIESAISDLKQADIRAQKTKIIDKFPDELSISYEWDVPNVLKVELGKKGDKAVIWIDPPNTKQDHIITQEFEAGQDVTKWIRTNLAPLIRNWSKRNSS